MSSLGDADDPDGRIRTVLVRTAVCILRPLMEGKARSQRAGAAIPAALLEEMENASSAFSALLPRSA